MLPGGAAPRARTRLTCGALSLCRFIKKLEHTWKALVHDGVSAMPLFTPALVPSASPQAERPAPWARHRRRSQGTCPPSRESCPVGGVPLAGQPQAMGSGFKPSARGTGRLPGGDSTPASWKGSRGQPDLEGQGPAGQRKLWKRAVEGVLGQHHMAPTPVATWARDPGCLGESSQSTSSRAPPARQHWRRVFPKRERP